MSRVKWFLCTSFTLVSASLLVAANPPTSQPADAKPVHVHKPTQPWSFLKTLTPEQTAQIEKIQADAAEQVKKIHMKEADDINALLTPDQLTELKNAQARHKEELAGRHGKPATQPAQ